MGSKPGHKRGQATGRYRECPRNLGTANSPVRGSAEDFDTRLHLDRQVHEQVTERQLIGFINLANDDLAALVQLGLRYGHLEPLVQTRCNGPWEYMLRRRLQWIEDRLRKDGWTSDDDGHSRGEITSVTP